MQVHDVQLKWQAAAAAALVLAAGAARAELSAADLAKLAQNPVANLVAPVSNLRWSTKSGLFSCRK